MTRKYGRIPDRPDHRDRLRAPRPEAFVLPSESLIWQQVPRSRDQGQTGSCVGHGTGGGLELQRVLDGLEDVPLSPLHCYDNARLISMAPGAALTDDGAQVRDGMMAAQKVGIGRESAWPLTEATVNTRPDATVDEAGIVFADHGYERVGGGGETLLQSLLHTLVSGPVTHGFDVPQSFEAYAGGVWMPQPGEPVMGGHCVYFAGFRAGANGPELALFNSWADWGESFTNTTGTTVGSLMWVASAFVLTPYFGDAWAWGAP